MKNMYINVLKKKINNWPKITNLRSPGISRWDLCNFRKVFYLLKNEFLPAAFSFIIIKHVEKWEYFIFKILK